MSWFARTIVNSLNLDDDEEEDQEGKKNLNENVAVSPENDESSPLSPNRGVKEDLSELTKTVTRQLWGVASFLAPPPSSDPNPSQSDPDAVTGMRTDFAEIGGRFRSGISKISGNMSEITSKMASNLLQFGSDEEEEEERDHDTPVVGVTDDVVAFVKDIAMHPATWLDFPLIGNGLDDEGQLFPLYFRLVIKMKCKR